MKNNQWKKITTTTSTFDAFIHWINWRVRSLNYAMDFVFLVDMLLLTRILYLMVVQLLIPVLLVPVSSHQLVLVIGEISVRQHQQVRMINFSNKQIRVMDNSFLFGWFSSGGMFLLDFNSNLLSLIDLRFR